MSKSSSITPAIQTVPVVSSNPVVSCPVRPPNELVGSNILFQRVLIPIHDKSLGHVNLPADIYLPDSAKNNPTLPVQTPVQ